MRRNPDRVCWPINIPAILVEAPRSSIRLQDAKPCPEMSSLPNEIQDLVMDLPSQA